MKIYIDDTIQHLRGTALQALVDILPPWRRAEAMKYRHEQGRAECAASYMLLCRALREEFGEAEMPSFHRDANGKPSLVFSDGTDHGWHFNMSHCRAAVAVAVSRAHVGVDIEMYGRYSDSLARYVLSDDELASLGATPDAHFTRLWTRKEALVKLTGEGLTSGPAIQRLLADVSAYEFEERVAADYVCTACWRRTD